MLSSNADADGDSDSSDSSSKLNFGPEFKSVLDEFREKWHQELKPEIQLHPTSPTSPGTQNVFIERTDEEKATSLFIQGTEMERKGKVFEAMNFYRKAINLVPDIEFKIYETSKNQNSDKKTLEDVAIIKTEVPETIRREDEEDLNGVDLISRFNDSVQRNGRLISSSTDKSVIATTSGAHFGDLPAEIILHILSWVILSESDLRFLEQSCIGLYLLARDSELLKKVCFKVWGISLGTLETSGFDSWRDMFIDRPRVQFNGCYISKTSYLRYGENSFQDQFYRPVQVVEYYRYIRFYPYGKVLVMTSSDEPSQGVGKMNFKNSQRECMLGRYRIKGDVAIIVLERTSQMQISQFRRRGSVMDGNETGNQTFFLELNIVSAKKRKFNQLQWKHYSLIQVKNKIEVPTKFELTSAKYPPLWFSKVKSYNVEVNNTD